jgi:hypothetical protein
MEAAVLLVLHDVFDGVFCSGGAGSRGPDGAARDGHGRDGAPEVHQWTFLSARAALVAELAVMVRGTASFFEFSLCLSRACLGKMIVLICKWLKNAVFRRTQHSCGHDRGTCLRGG